MKEDNKLDSYIQEVYDKIGSLIYEVRTKKKISMRQVYRDTGICIACLSQLENGTNFPRLAIVIKIATYLGISLNRILSPEVI